MKTTTIILSLAAGVLCGELPSHVKRLPPSLVERDIATVTSVVAEVDTSIKNLNTAVQSFNGDGAQMGNAATELISTLNSATSTIQGSSELSIQDAVSLQNSVSSLQTDGESLITNLQAKKPTVERAGLCDAVFQQTSQIATAGQALIAAVISKLPQSVQPVGTQLAAGVVATLQQPQQAFSPANCTNSNAGATGGAGGASTTVLGGTRATTSTAFVPGTTSMRSNFTATGFSSPTLTPATIPNNAVPVGVPGSLGGLAIAVAALLV